MQADLDETAWARGRRDFTATLRTFPFWVGQVMIGGVAGAWGAIALGPGSGAIITVAAILATAFIVWVGVTAVAPLWQRNEAREAVKHLQEANKPKLVFGEISHTPRKDEGGGQTLRILVRNAGGRDLTGCAVKLERLTNAKGKVLSDRLPVAIQTEAQAGREDRTSRFNLSRDENKNIYLAWFRAVNPDPRKPPRLLTERGASDIALPRPGRYLAVLRAFGGDAEPTTLRLQLTYHKDGRLVAAPLPAESLANAG